MKRNSFLFVLIIILMIITLSLKVQEIYLKNNSYTFSSYQGFEINGDTIIKYNGGKGNVTIPKMVNGVIITKIGNRALEGLEITDVVIPDSIIEIGDYAFANNKISHLVIPKSVKKIGEGAFIHNLIEELNISDDVILGNAVFNDNQLSDNVFFYEVRNDYSINYSKLISYGGKVRGNVEIPSSKEGVTLLTIGQKCFFENNLVAVSIPSTVKNIEESAFKGNYLVEIYLSSNMENIANDAFSDNNYLEEIIIDNYKDKIPNYPWGAKFSFLYWLKK